MTDKEKAELYWAYAISMEKISKRLVDKGIASREDVDETTDRLYENIHNTDIHKFSLSPGFADIMRTYLGKVPRCQYLSLTDFAREKNNEYPSYVIQSWLRSRNTIEFLRIWETKNNPDFNESECYALLEAMKAPSFTVTPKQWISKTNAMGLVSKQGKNGGTFAHPDISADFHMWLYPKFRLALIEKFGKGVEERVF